MSKEEIDQLAADLGDNPDYVECAIRNIGKRELIEIVRKAAAGEALLPDIGSIWRLNNEDALISETGWNGRIWFVVLEWMGGESGRMNLADFFDGATLLTED
jgi:hypothetical protein